MALVRRRLREHANRNVIYQNVAKVEVLGLTSILETVLCARNSENGFNRAIEV